MLYYRVKQEHDGARCWKFASRGGLEIDGEYIAGELLTPAEYIKHCKTHLDVADKFEQVEIKKSDIYFFFGARFAEVIK